jgi:Cdc6-like AAA superfamily ATPase
MEEVQLELAAGQGRLLIDSSKVSLKAVLLLNENKFPSIPLAHAVHTKEIYKNLEVFLQKMRYEEHFWNICADLKVIAMLTVLQGRSTKFCCF